MIFMMDAQCQPQMYSLALWSIVLQLTLACCTKCCFAPQAVKEANAAGEQETAEQERLVVQAAAGEEAA